MYKATAELGYHDTYEQARQAIRKYLRWRTTGRENRQPLSFFQGYFARIENLDVKKSK